MTICFVFKQGYELRMKCEEFTLHRNGLGMVTGYKAKGVTENQLIEFNGDDILCIYRELSDEDEADGGNIINTAIPQVTMSATTAER